jgi:hypothetical protein
MWSSICDNWWYRVEAIQNIPAIHLEKRCQAFQPFYSLERTIWERALAEELFNFKVLDEQYGGLALQKIMIMEQQNMKWLESYEVKRNEEMEKRRSEGDFQEHELKMEIAKACRNNSSQEEMNGLYRKYQDCMSATEEDIRAITARWHRWKDMKELELRFFFESKRWLVARKTKLAEIKTRFSQELIMIEKMQTVEFNELLPPTEDSEAELEVDADEPVDMNEAIAVALADQAVPNSPVDCPFQRGYGDSVESTRSEKNVGNNRNLLEIRGLEAVQVSSHRGPPTDRPPDKPREVGVFAGCLLERAGTRHSQLASFSRGSNCSSGNALPLAENAILGVCAIEQFRVHAAGTPCNWFLSESKYPCE